MADEKRDRIICFSTTKSMYDTLHALARTDDRPVSAVLRQIIIAYLTNPAKQDPQQ